MRSRRRRHGGGGEGSGVVVAIACVALAATLYLVGTLVWHLEDEDADVAPRFTRFTMAVE